MASSPRFQREKVTASFCEEVAPLLELHYTEIAHYTDIQLNPDFASYIAAEDAGTLRCFTARDESGLLIGYATFFIMRNPHYRSSIQAAQDVLFIETTRRGFGMRFIDWCDRELQAEGCQTVYHHMKKKHDFGRMLERLGYEHVDQIYARRLDRMEV